MTPDPQIPHGAKRVFGQLQKGDAIWNGEKFVKVKKAYPIADGGSPLPLFAIRKCTVEQPVLPGTEEPPQEMDLG